MLYASLRLLDTNESVQTSYKADWLLCTPKVCECQISLCIPLAFLRRPMVGRRSTVSFHRSHASREGFLNQRFIP